jgi:hypothetical protein
MVGYFSLTLPAGMGLYWLANNVFTTATTYYLKELGGATVTVPKLERPKLKLGTAIRTQPAEGDAAESALASVMSVDAPAVAAVQPAAVSVASAMGADAAAPAASAAASAPAPVAVASAVAAAPAAAADGAEPAAAAAAAATAAVVSGPYPRMPRRSKRMKDPALRKTGTPPRTAAA